ncbi:MAG: ABC transporter permease [Bryobacteraceae bacterium]|nr:ABC transporter permease [Bryobacteraceae bacterium]
MGSKAARWVRELCRRAAFIARRKQWHEDADSEIRFHLAMREDQNRAAGMTEDDARFAARKAFGNPLRLRDDAREAWLGPALEAFLMDLWLAARGMRRRPGYALLGGVTLALAIGACTAVFSLAYAVLLRPLPFPQPERLVRVYEDAAARGFPRGDTSPGNFRHLQQETRSFSALTMWHRTGATLTGEGEPERVDGLRTAANFFEVFGVAPQYGRAFQPGDDRPGAPPAVILSYRLWTRRYGGDPALVGRSISINDRPHLVLGVMPAAFSYPTSETQFWMPADLDARDWAKRGLRYFLVAGRLREGVSPEAAQSELDALAPLVREADPVANRDFRAVVVPLRDDLAGRAKDRLILLTGAVLLVLLIACANVAHLILSRSVRRASELALRLSLGASRGRLMRQLLAESLTISLVGGAAGFALAAWGLRVFAFLIPASMADTAAVRPDGAMAILALALALVAALLSGVVPAWRLSGVNWNESLRQGSSRLIGGFGQERLRGVLVVSEVAFAVMLVIGATLLVRTLLESLAVHPGFDSRNVLTATTLPPAPHLEFERRNEFLDEALRRVRALPGVTGAAYMSAIPFTWKGGKLDFEVQGKPRENAQGALIRQVTPGYFGVLRTKLIEGREFTGDDRMSSEPVAVVNRALARRYLDGNPTANHVRIHGPGFDGTWYRVVGVSEDVLEMGLLAAPQPMIYLSPRQTRADFNLPFGLAARTTGDPDTLVPSLRATLREAWPAMPVSRVRTLESLREAELAERRPMAILSGALAAVALLLASVGVYGLLSFTVAQRIPEFGIRAALGASAFSILSSATRRGVGLALAGTATGVAASLALVQLMRGLLYGVKPVDPMAFAAAPVLVLLLAMTACIVPAWSVMRVDPSRALRSE